jgi:hypothetical protein
MVAPPPQRPPIRDPGEPVDITDVQQPVRIDL